MSSGAKVPRSVAADVAYKLLVAIGDVCTRVAVAGSLRRGKAEVGDVELVVQPAIQYGANLLDGRMDDLLRMGVVEKRHAWGERYKALRYTINGGVVNVDLFVVLPDRQWGPTYLIRTGPGDANHALVTAEGMRTAEGVAGVRRRDMYFREGALWYGDGRRVDTPEEWHVFWALGLPWMPPHLRSSAMYARVAARARHWYSQSMVSRFGAWWLGAASIERRDSLWWPDDGRVRVIPSPYWLATGQNIEMRQERML